MGNVFSSRSILEDVAEDIRNGRTQKVRDFLTRVIDAKSSSSQDKETLALKAVNLDHTYASDAGGLTILHQAARYGQRDIVRLLLEELHGTAIAVDPNALDEGKRTPLHYAARNVCPPRCGTICQRLLAYGADPFIATADGNTALDLARREGCLSCVRIIEDKVKLWQGWVDYYQQEMLVIPTWKPKWLVVLLDRRPNTGPGNKFPKLSCSECQAVQHMPPFVPQFQCRNCRKTVTVVPSIQMAIYDPKTPTPNMVVPDVACPEHVVCLPQFSNLINAHSLDDATTVNTMKKLVEGSWRRAMQNTVASDRKHGVVVKILGARSEVLQEHSFRLQTEDDRRLLLGVWGDPVRAAYNGWGSMTATAQSQLCAAPQQRLSIANVSLPTSAATTPSRPPPPPPATRASAWNCAMCTYRHEGAEAALATCAMCDAPRGSDAVPTQVATSTCASVMPAPSAPTEEEVFAQEQQIRGLDATNHVAPVDAMGTTPANPPPPPPLAQAATAAGTTAGTSKETASAAPLDILPNDTVEWMWGDAGSIAGHAIAAKNPLRWSSAKGPAQTISEFAQYTGKDVERPVDVTIRRDGVIVKKTCFNTVADAMAALKPQGKMVDSAPLEKNSTAETTSGAASSGGAAENAAGTDLADDSGLCIICLEREANSAVVPCGHMCACTECLEGVKASSKPECPMCRGPMSSIIKIYRS